MVQYSTSVGVEATYRNPDHGRVCLDPVLVAVAHEAEGAHGTGRDELHRQDGVNLADELVADLDGRLGDGAAKLHESLANARPREERARSGWLWRSLRATGTTYLEVIRDVVLAAARPAEETVLILRGAALGLVRWRRLRVVEVRVRVLLRSRRVLGGARHGCCRLLSQSLGWGCTLGENRRTGGCSRSLRPQDLKY